MVRLFVQLLYALVTVGAFIPSYMSSIERYQNEHVMSKVGDTCRLAAAYRGTSALLSDSTAVIMAGNEKMNEIRTLIDTVEKEKGSVQANNLREGFAVRYKWFNVQLEKIIANNPIEQVVILGAGLDTRVYTLDALKGCDVFEVDQRHIIELKQNIIAENTEHFSLKAKTVHRVGATLGISSSISLLQKLKQLGFCDSKSTVWIYEGFTYYLDESVATSLLKLPLNSARNFVLFDAINTSFQHLPKTPISSLFTFGIDQPEHFLQRLGFSNISVSQSDDPQNTFGVIDTSVSHMFMKNWSFKLDRSITHDEDGDMISRIWYVTAETQVNADTKKQCINLLLSP